MTEKFHDYLYGCCFHILTDNNPLAHVITAPKRNPTDHRWLASLAPYDFTITYRAGKSNADADGLSRLPFMNTRDDIKEDTDAACICPFLEKLRPLTENCTNCFCSSKSLEAIVLCHQVMIPAIEVICAAESVTEDMLRPLGDIRPSNGGFPSISAAEWRKLQKEDPHISRVVDILCENQPWPVNLYDEPIEVRQILQERNWLLLRDNILYHVRKLESCVQNQLVLPYKLRRKALHGLHDEVGDLGVDRTLDLARSRFYWPGMARDVKTHVSMCGSCIKRKAPP